MLKTRSIHSHRLNDVLDCPTLQGCYSTTFQQPPLDGSLTVPELFAWHAKHSPDHPVFVYPSSDPSNPSTKDVIVTVHYPEVYQAIIAAAKLVKEALANHGIQQPSTNEIPVIGILATADTMTYFTLIVGIMHLGFTPFPISTRNSALGVAHLLEKTQVLHLFVSNDPAMQKLAHDAQVLLAEHSNDSPRIFVEISSMVEFNQLYNSHANIGNDSEEFKGQMSLDNVILIMHSSGSTAFPKPVKFLGRNLLRWGLVPYYGEVDICNMHVACHALPMFHAMGAINIVIVACTGSVMACFAPASPPTIPTPDTFFEAMVKTRCQLANCVPSFVEAWAQAPEKVPTLRALKAIIFGGAPLNKSIGDMLSSAGVNLTPLYGLTEVGVLSLFIPDKPRGSDWAYFQVSPGRDVKMIPQSGLDGIYEPVVLTSDRFSPNVLDTIIEGAPAYATRDLLEVHPTNRNMFRVFGRVDDQLMLSTGEKTNPGPLESILIQDPNIIGALMFGRGRLQNGVLIQPSKTFDPKDEVQLAVFRNKIWPTVEKVNNYAPAHSRIFKEMIIVTDPLKPLEFTPKGTVRRQVCIKSYSSEIDAIYKTVNDSFQPDLAVLFRLGP